MESIQCCAGKGLATGSLEKSPDGITCPFLRSAPAQRARCILPARAAPSQMPEAQPRRPGQRTPNAAHAWLGSRKRYRPSLRPAPGLLPGNPLLVLTDLSCSQPQSEEDDPE